MPTSTTPNMLLVLPSPSLEPGPLWALDLNTAFGRVDTHDHSTNNGVKVSQTGILFTADFSANNFRIIDLMEVTLVPQGGSLNTKTSLYANASGDLLYVDLNGNQIQLTANGILNSKGINGQYTTDTNSPSVFYTTATLAYTFTTDGTILANIRTGAINVGVLNGAFASRIIAATEPIHTVLIDTSAVTNVITLPTAAAVGAGRQYTFVDSTGAAGTRNITINRAGSNTINGAVSVVISTNRGVVRIVSDGVSNWVVV